MYRIKYTYDTGDSFHNEYNVEEFIETTFEDIELAKRNAKNIVEHYEMCSELDNYRSNKNSQNIIEKYADKEWFVPIKKRMLVLENGQYMAIDSHQEEKYIKKGMKIEEVYDEWAVQFKMKLFLDNGKEINYSTYGWCGYFEHLNCVEVVGEELKFNTK